MNAATTQNAMNALIASMDLHDREDTYRRALNTVADIKAGIAVGDWLQAANELDAARLALAAVAPEHRYFTLRCYQERA